MSAGDLIKRLAAAGTDEEKAAIVAESVIADLAPDVAEVARACGCVPWFDADVIAALSGNESVSEAEALLATIVALPFVEPVGRAWQFHAQTKAGWLAYHAAQQPELIKRANHTALAVYLARWQDDRAARTAIYALIVSGELDEAQERTEQLVTALAQLANGNNCWHCLHCVPRRQDCRLCPRSMI